MGRVRRVKLDIKRKVPGNTCRRRTGEQEIPLSRKRVGRATHLGSASSSPSPDPTSSAKEQIRVQTGRQAGREQIDRQADRYLVVVCVSEAQSKVVFFQQVHVFTDFFKQLKSKSSFLWKRDSDVLVIGALLPLSSVFRLSHLNSTGKERPVQQGDLGLHHSEAQWVSGWRASDPHT